MNRETKIQRAQMIALSNDGRLVFRNETARAWVGKPIHKAGRQVTLENATMLPFGLCVGSSDLVGITPIIITPDMVGQKIGVFTAWESKTPTGTLEDEQEIFINNIISFGGFAGVARTVQEALDIGGKA